MTKLSTTIRSRGKSSSLRYRGRCGTFALGNFNEKKSLKKCRGLLRKIPKLPGFFMKMRSVLQKWSLEWRAGLLIDPDYCQKRRTGEKGLVDEATKRVREKSPAKRTSLTPATSSKKFFAGDKARWEFNKPTKLAKLTRALNRCGLKSLNPQPQRACSVYATTIQDGNSIQVFYHADASYRVHPILIPTELVTDAFLRALPTSKT